MIKEDNMKNIFIDMDGVLADYIGPDGKVTMHDFNIPGFFFNKKPNNIIINAIFSIYPTKKYEYYILSACPTRVGIREKNEWLDKYFPVKYENRYFVKYPGEDKAKSIKDICNKRNLELQSCLLIDDTHKHLCDVELIGVNAQHPANLLIRYEEYLNKINNN